MPSEGYGLIEEAGKLNVIVYGLGNTLRDALGYIRARFHIVGCSDSDGGKSVEAERLGVPFVEKTKLRGMDFDYVLIVSVYDDEIGRYLTGELGLAEERVLRRAQWCRMLFRRSFGRRNPDKTFYVLSHPIHLRDGLFSYLFAFLEQMDFVEKNGYIPVVDMQNFWSQYLEEDRIGVENAWEYYFKPLSGYSLKEVYKSRNVILGYDDNCYKGNYDKKYDIKRMSELYQKYVRYDEGILPTIEKAYRDHMDGSKRTLGVLFRGTDMSALRLKNHPVQPTLEEMIALTRRCMKEWGCERVFLSTEDAAAAAAMKAEFGTAISYTDQKRFGHTGDAWLADIHFERENDRYLKGLEYLTTIELLSRCDCLLAGICAGSVCAQIMNNGRYGHVRMIDKGEYR